MTVKDVMIALSKAPPDRECILFTNGERYPIVEVVMTDACDEKYTEIGGGWATLDSILAEDD